jgi:AAA+ ATPase superfamily predicted ATPase
MTDYWLQKLRDKSLQSFVGRTQELTALLSLLSTDGPDELITHVYGVGGVGKTSLLDRFESLARKQFNAVVRINEAQKSIRDVLVKIAQDLSSFINDSSEFSQNYKMLLQLEQQVQSDPAFYRALQESSGRVYTNISGTSDISLDPEKEDRDTEYDLSVVREMLAASLDEVNIISFCYDRPEFRPVHDQLSNQMSKAVMLQHLIEYADRQLLMGKLISHVRQ